MTKPERFFLAREFPADDFALLELAAKAAGLEVFLDGVTGEPMRIERHPTDPELERYVFWNPRTDDGDALRLAVKLRPFLVAVFEEKTQAGDVTDGYDEPHGDDPCAATRRAIVRAAAEIGKRA